VARRAAQRGLSVTLIDDPKGKAASEVAAGMLAPVTEVHYGEEELLQLNVASARGYESFVAELESETGIDVGYRRCGTVMVARDADDNRELDDLFAFQRKLDLKVERLNAKEVRELEPGLSPRVRGGILAAEDHQVDPVALVTSLRTACVRAGVELVDARVERIETNGGSVTGVANSSGRVEAALVVVAAGAASGSLPGLPSPLPIRPVKGQLIQLAATGPFGIADRNVRGLEVYVVSRLNGRIIVGATVEELGFDLTVTAGAVHELLRRAYELLPGVTELRFVRGLAGSRPCTPDNAPLLGKGALEGLVFATGHFRNGVLLTPVTGDAIAELLATGTEPSSITAFSPLRFAPGAAV
jgi:glycine oxidase